jgi:hypothetical protein
MDIQQTINLEFYRRFEQAGIEFAFPTRTLHLSSVDLPGVRSLANSTEHREGTSAA